MYSLKKRMLLVSIVLILLWILTLTMTLRYSINASLEEIMKNSINSKTQVVEQVFGNFESELSDVLFEYAEWDDSYQAIISLDEEWINRNIIKFFEEDDSYNLDFYLLKNDDGSYLKYSGDSMLVDILMSSESDDLSSEYLVVNNDLYIVVESPVTSDITGEESGRMSVGQIVDSDRIDAVFNEYFSDDFLRVESSLDYTTDSKNIRINDVTEYYIEHVINDDKSFYIYYSFEGYHKDGLKLFTRIHILNLSISIIVISILLIVGLYLVKKLNKLTKEIDFVADGNYSYKIECFKSLELIKVSKHINNLSSAVMHQMSELELANLSSIMMLVNAIEAKDIYTRGHSDRVMKMALILSEGLVDVNTENLKIASILHDIGKISIPERVLNKVDKLTDEEFELIKKHPLTGYEILIHSKYLSDIRKIVLQHHERIDGKGYPNGLKGDEILLEAKIIQISDTFDAITSDRPYRKSRSIDEAIEILIAEKGKQFDPDLVDIFIDKLDEIKISLDKN